MSHKVSQRQVYRIRYSGADCPMFSTFCGTFPLVDCSEAGLRCVVDGAARPATGKFIQGTIGFLHGATVDASGFVLRVSHELVAIKFTKCLPASVIMEEQRWLRRRPESGTPSSVQASPAESSPAGRG